MNKNKGKKGKIIPFPNRHFRIMEEAYMALDMGEFSTAARFYLQALDDYPDETDALLGALTALYELEENERARYIFEEYNKLNPVKDYEILQLYLAILLNLKDYQTLSRTIEQFRFRRGTPPEFLKHCDHLLSAAKKVMYVKDGKTTGADSSFAKEKVAFILEGDDLDLQGTMILELSEQDSRPFLADIRRFLSHPDKHPILKTLLLSKLMEDQVDEEFTVEKFNQQIQFNPIQAEPPQLTKFIVELSRRIENHYAHTHPSIVGEALELIRLHGNLLFPLEATDLIVWENAYRCYLNNIFSIQEGRMEKIGPLVQEKMALIQLMEEIMNPFH